MRLRDFTVDEYLRRELRFWRTLEKVYLLKRPSDEVLDPQLRRVSDERVLALATKRFASLASLIKLFERSHLEKTAVLVSERLRADFDADSLLNLDVIRKRRRPEAKARSALAFGFFGDIVEIIKALIEVAAEAGTREVSVTPVGPIQQDLVAANARLTCEEVGALNYDAWVTYLLLMLSKGDAANHTLALICASCPNLSALANAYHFNYEEMLADDVTWLGAFLVRARLDECGLP